MKTDMIFFCTIYVLTRDRRDFNIIIIHYKMNDTIKRTELSFLRSLLKSIFPDKKNYLIKFRSAQVGMKLFVGHPGIIESKNV